MKQRYIYMLLSALVLMIFISPMQVWGQFGTAAQQPQIKNQYNILNSENGRFAFGQISDSSKDKFMLDTWTGRLWRITESGGIGLYLTPVPYRIEKGEYDPVPDEVSTNKERKTEQE
jgi:hypothetical protein